MSNFCPVFPVNKNYINTRMKEYDHLSYSYSCIKGFQQNQEIIGSLTRQTKGGNKYILDKYPKLFSTSGNRENPIFQPFYYNTACDRRVSSGRLEQKPLHCITNNEIKNDFKPDPRNFSHEELNISDKNVITRWFKYHFRYISRPFSKTIDDYFSRILKKNQHLLKIEISLNNVNENVKQQIKTYIHTLNLNVEERTNLCHDTFFEVDVTPIMEDSKCLQDLLKFLKNPELDVSSIKDSYKFDREISDINNNRALQKKTSWCKKGMNPYPSNLYSKTNDSEGINNYYKQQIKEIKNVLDSKNSNISLELDKINLVKLHRNKEDNKESSNLLTSQPIDHSFKCNKDNVKSPRTLLEINTPVSKTTKPFNYMQETFCKSELYPRNKTSDKAEHLNCNGVTNYKGELIGPEKGDFCQPPTNQDNSCKCFIHYNQADIYRCREQCLFGKGDEINNSFIKYLTFQEKHGAFNVNSRDEKLLNKTALDTCIQNKDSIALDGKAVSDEPIKEDRTGYLTKPYYLHCNSLKHNINTDVNINRRLNCSITEQNNKDNKIQNKSNKLNCYGCFDNFSSDSNPMIKTEHSEERKLNRTITTLNRKNQQMPLNSNEYCNANSPEEGLTKRPYEINNNMEDSRKAIFENQEDYQLRLLLPDNLNLDNIDNSKIDVVLQNAEELKAKALYLKTVFKDCKRKKLNRLQLRHNQIESLWRKRYQQDRHTKINMPNQCNKSIDYEKTNIYLNSSKSNKSLKYYFGPRNVYRSISSVFKFRKSKGMPTTGRIARTHKKQTENMTHNNESMNHSLMEDKMNRYSFIKKDKNKFSKKSQNSLQVSLNLENVFTELKIQREEINRLKKMLPKC